MRDMKSQRSILPDVHALNNINDLNLSFHKSIDPELGVEPITPNSAHGQQTRMAHQWSNGNQDAALTASPINVEDIAAGKETLGLPVLSELLDEWFTDYHRWIPILYKPPLMATLQNFHPLQESPIYIVFKTITAVTLTDPYSTRLNQLSDDDRQQLTLSFRAQVVMQAIECLTLQSFQALLIITILDYGAGKFSGCWDLVAICKRMAMQLGLRDMIQGDRSDNVLTESPRMLPPPSSPIEREEQVRAYLMTEALDGYTILRAPWNLYLLRLPRTRFLPYNEEDD